MAYEDRQPEFPLPGENPQKRESARHLPKYFRTDKNTKFLQSTLDQLLQPGVAEKVNAFVGRKTAKAYTPTDNYLSEVSPERTDYQLEPVTVVKDLLGNVEHYNDYRDFINQIGNFSGVNSNHSTNNQQEYYAWDPRIDWDKFANFREYYWLPTGPQTVSISGEVKEITSTYSVNLQEALGDYSYIFTPDGLTNNPTLKLYRGVKYIFEINTPGLPFTFRSARTLDDAFLLIDEVSAQAVENGNIELILGPGTPNEIYYVAENNINIGGLIKVANQEEATTIDVSTEIIGKKFYTTRDGWSLTNGLKVRFQGEVTPEKYANSEWYIEGVGDKIKLVSNIDVEVSFPVGVDLFVPFDNEEGFDRLPFGTAVGYPQDKDYITINRTAPDGNFWSRYNRWFHKDVITLSESINNTASSIGQSQRANRPIIEFQAGLKLYNFGTRSKQVVDVIDDYTVDAFSTIEGSLGYNIDSVQLSQGMRVLFLADTDPLVKGKIFEVNFIRFTGSGTAGQISLVETADSDPTVGENVLVTQGEKYSGSMWYYDSTNWNRAQEKTSVNQPPVFDVFDINGNSYANTNIYPATTFRGTKLFSYREGTGSNDTVLGFPLSYRSISNVGDIVFDFNFNSDTSEYQIEDQTFSIATSTGFLRKYYDHNQYELLGAYTKAEYYSSQSVVLQYTNDNTRLSYPIDCYTQSAFLTDLIVRVFVNNTRVYENVDYELINTADKFKAIRFLTAIPADASIIIRSNSATSKNSKGYYEIAPNLEKNPNNDNVKSFTLGEVTDHVSTIVEHIPNFDGIFPGPSNLRDLNDQSRYGKKFIKHSAPLNLAMFSLLDKDSNLIKSLRFSRKEYAKFKRLFLETAETLGFDGEVKQHVDAILTSITKDKINTMPFYFSDMVAFNAAVTTRIVIEDIAANFYALTTPFALENLSTRSVTVYLNNVQLLHGIDYTFNSEGYLDVTATKEFGDILEINEYDTTNGSYIPPTPTKLGLYPKYIPEIFIDTTYTESPTMIRGHDGSLTKSYDDYRDNLLLELERRIFNNIKVNYDPTVFDIHSYLPSSFRKTGFTRTDVYTPMIADFVQWLQLVDEDYTNNKYFSRENSFTFNYSNLRSPAGERLPGWWRGVYKQIFDTDRPHTNPWEMLGFTIKPTWWETQYGPAPYTKENKLLWEDLEAGMIREPNKAFKINPKYARPGLSGWLPVDAAGNLLSPSDANIALRFSSEGINDPYVFGDNSPVESAWTSSSEYPFALITSWAINSPSTLLASGFDRSRQVRNVLGQLVYSTTMDHLKLSDIIFPNISFDGQEVLTAGVVNYVAGYLASSVTSSYDTYIKKLKSIKNCLGFKLGGFTDKKKFKLILDSRTPLNQGNVFVPEENYQIILNTSYPIKTINYSGVIVEKTAAGFIIRGYDNESPFFKYYTTLTSNRDIPVNVGGISEPFSNWEPGQTYVTGKNVQYQSTYYRVLTTHTAAATFDATKYVKLPKLPTNGGAEAIFKDKFYTFAEEMLPYGSLLRSVQEVVDFLLGYESWLKEQGFRFEYYDGTDQILSDWKNSCREFMFWTTQSWGAGALITLSPVADEINFETEYSTVDNIFDNFYGYSLLKADGKKLVEEFTRISRQEPNKFKLRPKITADGIYAVQIPLIQKEHVVLIDNYTVFGDVIYQPPTGYRQERIKILGYKTTDWDGSLNIPGFIYNEAKVTEWASWQDYDIGSLVKYKEFYYTANDKIVGEETFTATNWVRLAEKPESGLLTNFEYKVNQFADFYDLDTDNFDVEQQKFAQHLIGYQNRDYLANIINDDVSQYKFYQGMIQDKGTRNSLDKLFDVLSSADRDSLDFYEEWAVKQGQYGASEGFEEVEFLLNERNMRIEPQPFLLTNNATGSETDLVYRIKDYEVYKKSNNYTSELFPTLDELPQYTRNAGYVHTDDVSKIVATYDNILDLNFNDLDNKQYVWVGNEKLGWNVYQHQIAENIILSLVGNANAVSIGAPDKNQFIAKLNNAPKDIQVGDIIGLYDLIITEKTTTDSTVAIATQTTAPVEGFFKVLAINLNEIIIDTNLVITDVDDCRGRLTKLVPVRASNYTDANTIAQAGSAKGSLLWIDGDANNNWNVIKNNQPFNLLQKITAEETGAGNLYAQNLAVDGRNVTMAVASPAADIDGKVFIYTRGSNNQNYQFSQIIEPIDIIADSVKGFGKGIALSADGNYLIVGSPDASNVKTKFKGNYSTTTDYQNNELVRYSDQIWEALVDISGAKSALPFGSFGSIIEVLQNNNITTGEIQFNNLLLGKYPFENDVTDHILVRAPADQYKATGVGDTVFLDWYLNTTANQDQTSLTPRQPFNGLYPEITETFLESGLVVQRKVDVVLYVNAITTLPQVGQQIDATGAFGYVSYIFATDGKATIYVENTVGTWDTSGSLFLETGEFIGLFEKVAPIEQLDTSDELGGYWWFDIGQELTFFNVNEDEGRALAVYNIIPLGKEDVGAAGGNIYDLNNTALFAGETNVNSYIRTLSYQGSPGANGTLTPFLSELFVIRAPADLTDQLIVGDTVGLEIVNLPRYNNGYYENITVTGLQYYQTNKKHELYALWDGYINFELENSDDFGRPYEPRIGQFVRDRRTGATARVTFYQRNGVSATIFVDSKQGNWSIGTTYGQSADIEFLGLSTDPSPVYSVTRRLGDIKSTALGNAELNIGKLCVFQLDGVIDPIPLIDTYVGAEYIIYKDFEILGRPTQPNVPSATNLDWRISYNVPANADGVSNGLTNYGFYTVYARENISTFTSIGDFIVPEQLLDLRLGSKIKIAKNNDLYKAFIGCQGDGTSANPGRIYFVNNGVDEQGISYNWELAKDKRYKGEFGAEKNYIVGDIIFFDGEFYIAQTNVQSGDNFDILDWSLATSDSIRSIDYIGYVPNDTQFVPGNDSSLQINRTNLIKFGHEFDVSDNGEVLVVVAEYASPAILEPVVINQRIESVNIIDGGSNYTTVPKIYVSNGLDDSSVIETEVAEVTVEIVNGSIVSATVAKKGNNYTTSAKIIVEPAIERKVIVYRNVNGNYQKSQELLADSTTSLFGAAISISQDGKLIAVGAPNDSNDVEESGAIFVYSQQNGQFVLTQELQSTQPMRGEMFGASLEFDGRTLFASAYNASSDDDTTFDFGSTQFDNSFTNFKNIIANNGVVYVYDRIDDSLIFGQTLDYHTYDYPAENREVAAPARFFGRNILAKNNHLYSALPAYPNSDGKIGLILDYRRPELVRTWESYRTPSKAVDISKIKRVMLYDKDKNVIIENLDYIDPVQGKIAGIADEEIRYKTVFDPATYTTGTSAVDVDATEHWGPSQAGQVWWDLTNAKFLNVYQGNIIYKTNNFNKLFLESSIDVYEWVETKYTPQQWDKLSSEPEGETLGVSGISKYGSNIYAQKRVYDSIAQSFTNYYYFWVKNKNTIPDSEHRSLSVDTITKLIEDPAGQGYKFISFLSPSEFTLFNCNKLISASNVVLSIQYWTYSDRYSGIHNQYQLLTEGLDTSKPYSDIENKWFDSLVGYDKQSRTVPDTTLSVKEKYGILNKPRQSWFVNKTEALKQVIERVNQIMINNLIVDEKDINRLLDKDIPPSAITRLYDTTVDTAIDLNFVGVARAETATLSLLIEDSKLTRVDIINPGRGYKVAPTYEIIGTGTGAEIELSINNLGQVIAAEVIEQGINYNDNASIIVRPFAVLVNADENIRGNWGLYNRNVNGDWIRVNSQAYDVTKYWEYTNWYATSYNKFTEVDFVIGQSYELEALNDKFGDIVKILNVGGGGWLLLEKIDNQDTTDYTINYKTIGKQNGTIQFKDNLYNFDASRIGFDTQTFDTQFFDAQPIVEIRIVLETLRDNILVNDLATQYNELFFASLRYVFSEQGYVDWAFKTSFIKAQHNVGLLEQHVTFRNDNLSSYESYIQEVKSYKSKIREFVSNYAQIERSSSVVTDFDSPPRYSALTNLIETNNVRVIDGILLGSGDQFASYPAKHWLDNVTYKVTSIEISDKGQGYTSAPIITLEGNATAKASLGPNGVISSIIITDPGSGYLVSPQVTINGSLRDGGTPATLAAKIGDGLVRTTHTIVKFDRVSGTFLITQLNETETASGTGSKTLFDLKWPMDLRTNTIEVNVNGELVLNSRYIYSNVINTASGYTKYYGRVQFIDPPANNSIIEINYKKSITLLDAQDRISLFYNPTSGQVGNDIAQLMTGIDYGGVEVKSYEFGGPPGWDSDAWYDGAWDIFDETFDEETFETDGSTLVFQLAKPLDRNVKYNVYINGIRVDDEAYDGTSSNLGNKNAFMQTITGNGVTDTFTIENEFSYRQFLETNSPSGTDNPPAETITIRKSTSDGSLKINDESFDTAITGGDLAYTTATGISADAINVDGDGFVTPTTSAGPEETVPGQVLDTLDISVYERPVGGSSLIQTVAFRGDNVTRTFDLRQKPFTFDNVIVKINYEIVEGSAYRLDYENNQITFYTAPTTNSNIVIISMGVSGSNLLDYDEFVSDGSTQEFLTSVAYTNTVSAFVTVNGEQLAFELAESDDTYAIANNCVIRFTEAPAADLLIQFALFNSEMQSFSQVTVDEIIADGSSTAYQISKAPFSQTPAAFHTIVTVNNKVLNAGYSEVFTVTSSLEYKLKVWQVPVGSVEGKEIEVYLNNEKLSFLQDWTYEGAGSFNPNITPDAQPGSTVILNRGVAAVGDTLKVNIISNGEYRFGYFDNAVDSTETFIDTTGGDSTPSIVYFDETFVAGSVIRVYQFSNHDSQGIDRENYDVVSRTEMTVGSEGYYDFRLLSNGLLKLRQAAVSVDYVWIALNGKWLTPTADYILLENKEYIKFITPIVQQDVIDIIHFSNAPISAKFGWRQFKDMLNRTHYKRLNKEDKYTLAEPLNWYDRSITLVEQSGNLPSPAANSKIPGILFVNGERIEFFRRENNVLKQLRRGTLGTGVKALHPAGSAIFNQGIDSTIPYKDAQETVISIAGEYQDMSLVYPTNSPDMSVTSIAYNFNNNTVFPLGGQVATIDGTGFRPSVQVYVQDTACDTTYISDTQLQFITPAKAVGAYDLVIYNDTELSPLLRAATSIVVTKALPYVQILLPFAPQPNPATSGTWNPVTETGWYKEPFAEGGIPSEYWEAQDIEVFANGTRLRKNPVEVYDVTLGQFSPDGDKWLEAEYAVNKNIGAYVRLTTPPEANTKLTIIRKQGQIWNEITDSTTGAQKPLGQSQTEVATFLRGKTIDLPR